VSVTKPGHSRSGGDPDREAEADRRHGDDGHGGHAGHGGAHAAPVPSGGAALRTMLRETVIVVGMALLLSLIVKTWLLQAFYIPSGSMEDTLVKGDRVIVSKLTPGPFDLHRGDVVVFEDPDHWLDPVVPAQRSPIGAAIHSTLTFVGLLPSDEGNHLIKRVIGLPGDHITNDGQGGPLKVNGVAVNEPYLKPGDSPSLQAFDIRVPAGRVWVMGDHRSDSSDSRFHPLGGDGSQGSVPERLIVGRAVTVVWPLSDWRWLGEPSATFAKVPAAQSSGKPSAQVK